MMSRKGLSRRSFIQSSAGAAAASMLLPYASFARAQSSDIRVSMWDAEPTVGPQIEEISQGFAEQFGGTIVPEYTPDSYNEKLLAGLAGGNAPDVFLWWNYPALVSRGGLEDLTPYSEGDSPLDTSLFYEQVLNVGRIGDGLYGIPKDWTPRAIYYNKTVFDNAGIPYPTNDWTWDEFVDIATALTMGEGPDKQYGWWSYDSQYPIQGFVWSNGGDFISPDGMTATGYLDSPETIEAVTWYVSLQAELGIAPTAQTTATIGDNAVLFTNNKLAMFDTGIWPLQSFLQTPDLEFGTVLPPKANNGHLSCVLHQADWCLNPDGQNKELAWEVLKWMVSPEAAAVWGRSGFSLPAQPAVVEELGLLDDPIRSTFFEAVENIDVLPWFIRTTKGPEVEEELNLAIQTAFLGEASVEDSFKAAAPIIDSILQS